MIRVNCDTVQGRHQLQRGGPAMVGAMPRQTVYGATPGLIPYGEEYPDDLVNPDEIKEVIAYCHAEKIFPMYHQQATWAPEGFKWDQNGLGFCWAWSLTAAVMDCRAREGKPTVELAPISLGWLTGWRNQGYYLSAALQGAKDRGIAPASFIPDPHSLRYRQYNDGWKEAASLIRVAEAWDADPRNMILNALSILRTGTPGYIAYDWWGHALELVGMIWDESVPNNIIWVIRNSHGEIKLIYLEGSRGVPDELIGIRATLSLVA